MITIDPTKVTEKQLNRITEELKQLNKNFQLFFKYNLQTNTLFNEKEQSISTGPLIGSAGEYTKSTISNK